MSWVLRSLLLFILLWNYSLNRIYGQQVVSQSFGLEDGLESPELLLVFIDHDNRIIAIDARNNCYSFENGKFTFLSKHDFRFIRNIPHYCYEDYCLFFKQDHILIWQNNKFSLVSSDIRGQGRFTFTSFRDSIYEVRDRSHIRYFNPIELKFEPVDESHDISRLLRSLSLEGHIGRIEVSDDENFMIVWVHKKGKYLRKYNSDWQKLSTGSQRVLNNKLFTFEDQNLRIDSAKQHKLYNLSNELCNQSGIKLDHVLNPNNGKFIQFRISCSSQEDNNKYLLTYKGIHHPLEIDHIEAINIQNHEFFNEYKCIMATHEGLKIYNNNIKFFDSRDPKMISSIHAIGEYNDNIFFGGYGSGLSKWNGNSLDQELFNSLGKNQFLPGYTKSKGIPYFLVQHYSLGLFSFENNTYHWRIIVSDQDVNTVGFYLDTLRDGRIGIGTSQLGFGVINSMSKDSVTTKNYDSRHNLHFKNVLTFAQDQNDRIWMGHPRTGIGILDLSRDLGHTHNKIDSIKNSFGGYSMEIDHNGDLWVGSLDAVYYLKEPEKYDIDEPQLFSKFQKIPLPDGGNSPVTVLKNVNDYLVIGNQSAMSFIDLNKFKRGTEKDYPIYQYLYGIHIPGGGTEQNAVLHHGNDLWIGCHYGALQFEIDNLYFNDTDSKIEYKKGSSGGLDMLLNSDNEITLSKDNRNCSIEFGLIDDPNVFQDVYFAAIATDNDQDTIFTQPYALQGVVDISYLPPGHYDLEVKAYRHGLKVDERIYKMTTPSYLTERPWFWICLVGIPFVVLSSFIYILGRQRNKVLERERDISQLQAQTDQLNIQRIVNSFNPHFINNSLHWIQSRYRKDDKLVKVVGRLSENIYAIFQQTIDSKAVHSISDEITFVINYLDIQQVRFDQRFTYTISDTLTKKTKSDLEVILMQIQIHVENAIEHGIQNSDKRGVVKISLEENNKNVIIKIEDNGIGRQGAKMLQSKGTGNGTAMLNELHEIFNEKNITKLVQQYEDGIFTDAHQPYGTRVTITLPKDYNYGVK